MYLELTGDLYNELRSEGYKYIIHGDQLTNDDVGYEGSFGHFELIPAREEPYGQEGIEYYDIDSPEVLEKVNGIDLVFFWINKNYNVLS